MNPTKTTLAHLSTLPWRTIWTRSMDRVGHGRQCLLRGICENAQVHHHVGIMAELLNVLLT